MLPPLLQCLQRSLDGAAHHEVTSYKTNLLKLYIMKWKFVTYLVALNHTCPKINKLNISILIQTRLYRFLNIYFISIQFSKDEYSSWDDLQEQSNVYRQNCLQVKHHSWALRLSPVGLRLPSVGGVRLPHPFSETLCWWIIWHSDMIFVTSITSSACVRLSALG